MPTAAKPNSDRVRQIAILVSSVDAVAARQLLLHLPTDLAKQVRALASQLGPISPAEKRSILAAFQQSNAGGVSTKPAAPIAPQAAMPAAKVNKPVAADAIFESKVLLGTSPEFSAQASPEEETDDNAPAWTKLSTEALVRFVQGERVAVVAVVISQLAPRKAVEVLQRLPKDMNHSVIKRLSHLQDIDPDATATIDEHLVERLSQYEVRVESEHENTRRLNALMSAAPLELQNEWRGLLAGEAIDDMTEKRTAAAPKTIEKSTQATIAELYGDAVIMTDNMTPAAQVAAAAQAMHPPAGPDNTAAWQTTDASQDVNAEGHADVIPFPSVSHEKQAAEKHAMVDRTLLHAEFERILLLSPQDLAVLLSNLDSQTVLLAFAGATPGFMQRFTRMLQPSDAKLFVRRLQNIGPMRLRDVDKAQGRIVERAASLLEANETKLRRAA